MVAMAAHSFNRNPSIEAITCKVVPIEGCGSTTLLNVGPIIKSLSLASLSCCSVAHSLAEVTQSSVMRDCRRHSSSWLQTLSSATRRRDSYSSQIQEPYSVVDECVESTHSHLVRKVFSPLCDNRSFPQYRFWLSLDILSTTIVNHLVQTCSRESMRLPGTSKPQKPSLLP